MTSITHREGAIVGACVGTVALQELGQNPIMSENFILLAYIVMFYVNYVVGQEGAKYSDKDHLWKNIKEKTALNKIINTILHLTGYGHRNPITHSFDLWLISYILLVGATKKCVGYIVLQKMIIMLLTAFYIGYFTHLILDALSMDGTRLFFWNSKIKLHLVPKSGKIDKDIITKFFIAVMIASFLAWQLVSIATGIVVLIIGFYLETLIIKMTKISFKTGINFDDPNNWETMVYNNLHKLSWIGLGLVVFYGLTLAIPGLKEGLKEIHIPTLRDLIENIMVKIGE